MLSSSVTEKAVTVLVENARSNKKKTNNIRLIWLTGVHSVNVHLESRHWPVHGILLDGFGK